MIKLLHSYLSKNKSIENVLDSMDEHIEVILVTCIIFTLFLYIRTPLSSYVHEFIAYIQPEHFELMGPIAYGTVGYCLRELGLRTFLRNMFTKREYNKIRPFVWLCIVALTVVIFNAVIYGVNWFFSNLGYMLLLLGAYIILVFFGLLLLNLTKIRYLFTKEMFMKQQKADFYREG